MPVASSSVEFDINAGAMVNGSTIKPLIYIWCQHNDFGDTNNDITISGGGAILFSNNMHQSQPKISVTNNNAVRFVNCYVRSTGAVVSN